MDNNLLPIIPSQTYKTPKVASEDAFYAVAAANSPTQEQDYDSARLDLEQTGSSPYVDTQKKLWDIEQGEIDKEVVSGIMADKTLSPELKKNVLRSYAITGKNNSTLRDRYIQKTASLPIERSVDDVESQEAVIDVLGERIARQEEAINNKMDFSGYLTIMNIMGKAALPAGMSGQAAVPEATTSIAAQLGMSIPAGALGLIEAIYEQDMAKGEEIIKSIQAYAYEPKDETSLAIRNLMLEAIDTLGIPARAIGNFINTYTDIATKQYAETMFPEQTAKGRELGLEEGSMEQSAALATATEIMLDPLNLLGVKVAKGLTQKTKDLPPTIVGRGEPKIAVDSPLETTLTANPIAAEALAAKAVLDPTGKWAQAVGAERGQIIHDWVFHDVIPSDVQKAKPDLIQALRASEADIKETFARLRYDPLLINATAREAEVAQILQLTKESSLPHYNDAMSLITETDSLFQGNAVFGRNATHGYARAKDAQIAYNNLKHAIDQLPPELQGELAIVKYDKQHYLNWQWKREYDPIADKIFSKESINTKIMGLDASWIARSWAGKHLFPTDRFPKWVQDSALVNTDLQAGLNEQLVRVVRDRIATTRHSRELDHLINYAEERGLNYISEAEISSMHPKLSTKEVADLFETHTWWNQLQTYNHNFLNRKTRSDLVSNNMQGLYDKDGNYLGAASEKIDLAHLEKSTEVWDFDKGVSVPYNKMEIEASGRKVIRVKDEIEFNGNFYNYALTGKNANLNLLPKVVLPKLPGYSGRRVKESYYVDVVPKKRVTNGVSETDPKGLVQYTNTKAAARNRHEGEKIAQQLAAKYPDHAIVVRPERTEHFGRVLTDYQIHEENLRHSMKRGERLPSLNGPARLDDRMLTVLDNIKTVSRVGAFGSWDEAFRTSFTKGFPEFLDQGKFPEYKTDIKFSKVSKTPENEKAYKTAHELWDQYSMMKNMETRGDFIWTEALHGIADVLENWKFVPNEVVEKMRGRHTNPLMIAKTAATTFYLYLHPARQMFIQALPQQLEMYALNPKTAPKIFQNTLALRSYLAFDAKAMAGYNKILQPAMAKLMEKSGNPDFLKDAKAIKESGLLDSADMNSIVHGVFREVDRGLVETLPEQVYRDIETAVKVLPRAARTVGFDLAELTNRVGNWLQVKDMWIAKNPGKSWETKEAKAQIAAEASKLSGAMNRAGSMPMQRGMFSIIGQFTAIQHKMLMSLLQDNGTILTDSQRLRLAVVRGGMHGVELGVPGGVIAYYLIDKSDNETIKENADIIRRGLVDKGTNAMLRALVEGEENVDLAMSKSMSPYSEGFLPYLSMAYEARKLFDNKPEGPRYPAIGIMSSFYQAIEDMKGWYVTRDINETTAKQIFFEAAEVASGMGAYQKGLLMLGMQDNVTKMGNKYGLEFTASEAYARMFIGVPTLKEEQLFKLVELEKNPRERKKEMASFIHKQIMNQEIKLGADFTQADKIKRLSAFMSLLKSDYFTDADKADVVKEVLRLDEFSYRSVKSGVMANLIKNRQQELTEDSRQTLDILRKLKDPETQKVLEILEGDK